jgi:hypothetical protein
MHGYLFVSDHPYCTLTDLAGRFELIDVPVGDYELVVWLPAWEVARRERDPESTAVTRIFFAPHHEWRKSIAVRSQVSGIGGQEAGVRGQESAQLRLDIVIP